MELITYLLFVIFKLSASNAYIEIFRNSKTWFEATNECFIRGGRLANSEDLNQSTCAYKSIDIWLGKYDHERLTPWIAKLGCYDGGIKHQNPQTSVLECYRSCNSTAFGFKEPRCSCEEENKVAFKPDSTCFAGLTNYVWLYNKSHIDARNDDYTKNCLTAQCTVNGTIFRAADCSSKKFAYCQAQSSMFDNAEHNTHGGSETFCKTKSDHLIVNQTCSSFRSVNSTPEFWTGMQRYRYNSTGILTDIYKCVYVRCESGLIEPTEYTENCRRQLDGFACIFNSSSNNVTTVGLSPESSLAPTTISSSEFISLNIELTSVPLELVSDRLILRSASPSIHTSSTSTIVGIIDYMSTTANSSFSKTEFKGTKRIHSVTATMNSYFSRVTPNPISAFATAIDGSFEFSASQLVYVSTNVLPHYKVETSVFREDSLSMYVQSSTENSILPTSVISGLFSDHSSEHVVSASIKTSLIPSKPNDIELSTTVYSSVVTYTNRTELRENNILHKTTTMNSSSSNNSKSQFSTGLIVGVSLSILVVLIIGLFGIFRLRKQCPFKDKALDYTIPMTIKHDPNYLDIDVNLEKETHVTGNVSTQPMLTTMDDDKQFNTPNGTTNIPNDVYAVVVKNGIPITPKTENNQDKDENTSSNKPESDYYILHQSRRISGNESNTIYDTSGGGHNDDNDPTYNTTTHVHAN